MVPGECDGFCFCFEVLVIFFGRLVYVLDDVLTEMAWSWSVPRNYEESENGAWNAAMNGGEDLAFLLCVCLS